MDSLKVLHVIASMNPATGGVCQAVRTIVGSLNALNVKNEVVSLDDVASDFISKDLFVLHALGVSKGPWAYNPNLKPWLLQNIERFNCIIVHGLWLYPSHITTSCLKVLKKRNQNIKTNLFVMPHGMLDPYFQKAEGRKLKALRNKIYWQLVEAKVINEAQGLLFTCEEEKILARKPFNPYRPKQEIVVGLGVDQPPAFASVMREAFLKKCPTLKDDNYILFLSRIHEKKGVDLLVKAYISAKSNQTGNKISLQSLKLVIAGPGLETDFGTEIKRIIAASPNIKNDILFPGMLEGDAKWGAFYGCDSFILPSHQENFGIAVVEALACGKPVLISDQVNIWREIKLDGAGIVENDSEIGAQKLLENWICLTEKQRKTMEENALFCYNKNFAIGQSSNKLLSAISSN